MLEEDTVLKMLEEYYNKDKTILTLPDNFNESLDNVIFPDTLQSITFGYWFDQPLNNVKFPGSLIKINFSSRYENMTINSIPFSIIELKFQSIYKPITNLPINVKKIIIQNIKDSNLSLLKLPFGCELFDRNNEKINTY